jgi:hypothetical protein
MISEIFFYRADRLGARKRSQKVIAVNVIDASEVNAKPSAAPKIVTNAPMTIEPRERMP